MKKLVIAKVLAGTGVAVAASAAGAALSTPEEADNGLDTANQHASVTVPVAAGYDDQAEREDTTPDQETVEVESADVEQTEATSEAAPAPEGAHGAAVVAAVEGSEPGAERGEAVSDVASENGRTQSAAARAEHGPEDVEPGAAAEGRRP